jgi:hypothetical protein
MFGALKSAFRTQQPVSAFKRYLALISLNTLTVSWDSQTKTTTTATTTMHKPEPNDHLDNPVEMRITLSPQQLQRCH